MKTIFWIQTQTFFLQNFHEMSVGDEFLLVVHLPIFWKKYLVIVGIPWILFKYYIVSTTYYNIWLFAYIFCKKMFCVNMRFLENSKNIIQLFFRMLSRAHSYINTFIDNILELLYWRWRMWKYGKWMEMEEMEYYTHTLWFINIILPESYPYFREG